MSELPLLYSGSVKDVRGPVRAGAGERPAVVFDYTDAYSVFDWGKMPDSLPGKGEALAVIAADGFEKIERAESWREFSRSPEALALRRGSRFGSEFIELGEKLQRDGLRTHYLGVPVGVSAGDAGAAIGLATSAETPTAFRRMAVKPVSVVKPALGRALGRTLADYSATRAAPLPRLIPLEVVFRFSCPPGSSLLERVARDPDYLAGLGYGDLRAEAGAKWEFPVLELFTKLESSDRLLGYSEALAISGLSTEILQEMLFRTAWVAAWIRSACARAGLELADGKLEWGLAEGGELWLVDAIGPDELRMLTKDGTQLSKEFLRTFYRRTPWYEALTSAKREAQGKGSSEWKKRVAQGPPPLPPRVRELGSQLYRSLANELTGRRWFEGAWDLERVAREIREIETAARGGLT